MRCRPCKNLSVTSNALGSFTSTAAAGRANRANRAPRIPRPGRTPFGKNPGFGGEALLGGAKTGGFAGRRVEHQRRRSGSILQKIAPGRESGELSASLPEIFGSRPAPPGERAAVGPCGDEPLGWAILMPPHGVLAVRRAARDLAGGVSVLRVHQGYRSLRAGAALA